MNKLLVVDGSNLLFQMFFGMPSRIVNKRGKAIHGTLGFIGALIKVIKLTEPTHVIVVFDGEHENIRTEISLDYKKDRIGYENTPENENPFSQLNDIYSALNFMQIKHYETDVLEADDEIASYVLNNKDHMNVTIVSHDSDFFQLICNTVTVLKYRGVKTILCDTEYVKEKYGILPTQYVDFKSLTGDSSDNIKGVEKVGVKTASQLINQFNSLNNLINNTHAISKLHIRESISKSIDRLLMNYKLIKLKINNVKIDIVECVYFNNNFKTNDVLNGIGLYE